MAIHTTDFHYFKFIKIGGLRKFIFENLENISISVFPGLSNAEWQALSDDLYPNSFGEIFSELWRFKNITDFHYFKFIKIGGLRKFIFENLENIPISVFPGLSNAELQALSDDLYPNSFGEIFIELWRFKDTTDFHYFKFIKIGGLRKFIFENLENISISVFPGLSNAEFQALSDDLYPNSFGEIFSELWRFKDTTDFHYFKFIKIGGLRKFIFENLENISISVFPGLSNAELQALSDDLYPNSFGEIFSELWRFKDTTDFHYFKFIKIGGLRKFIFENLENISISVFPGLSNAELQALSDDLYPNSFGEIFSELWRFKDTTDFHYFKFIKIGGLRKFIFENLENIPISVFQAYLMQNFKLFQMILSQFI